MITAAEITQQEQLLAIRNLLREDIEAQRQPEIEDSESKEEEERIVFDFSYYLQPFTKYLKQTLVSR